MIADRYQLETEEERARPQLQYYHQAQVPCGADSPSYQAVAGGRDPGTACEVTVQLLQRR